MVGVRRLPACAPDRRPELTTAALAVERGRLLAADPARVVARLFVPGQAGFDHEESRSTAVLRRVVALDEDDVAGAVSDALGRCGARHRDLAGTFARHFDAVADRLDPDVVLSDARRLLIGATFTCEYALEGGALCNPSLVAHPDQAGAPAGGLRVVMSVRAIGEGHQSSLGFRTGTVGADGRLELDAPPRHATVGRAERAPVDADVARAAIDRFGTGRESATYLLDRLGDRFTAAELETELVALHRQRTRRRVEGTAELLRSIADRSYAVSFDDVVPLAERVLWPASGAERNGIEDARFVRFEDGRFYATYTAYDGIDICQQLLATDDFTRFASTPIVGAAAANKGLALFPRRIGGRFAALSRCDRETNAVAFSDHPGIWDDAVSIQAPRRTWELLQLGNCGSPIETDAGWLVLTHGVGPMRTYSIGAVLLDLDDPTRVVGQLDEPLLGSIAAEQDGYVPNVVYSCGALAHGGVLVLPYGISDAEIGVATVPLADVLGAITSA